MLRSWFDSMAVFGYHHLISCLLLVDGQPGKFLVRQGQEEARWEDERVWHGNFTKKSWKLILIYIYTDDIHINISDWDIHGHLTGQSWNLIWFSVVIVNGDNMGVLHGITDNCIVILFGIVWWWGLGEHDDKLRFLWAPYFHRKPCVASETPSGNLT